LPLIEPMPSSSRHAPPDRIVCIGAANLDRKLRSLAPLQMGTSNPAEAHESFGGVARNIAENLARLGAPVALMTAVGNDAAGAALLAHARAAGIDTGATLTLAGACSGTYTVVLDGSGDMVVALADMGLYERLTPAWLAAHAALRASAAMVVADLNLPFDTVAALIAAARRDQVALVRCRRRRWRACRRFWPAGAWSSSTKANWQRASSARWQPARTSPPRAARCKARARATWWSRAARAACFTPRPQAWPTCPRRTPNRST
jgi:sugar/nucleoside kinase (ribokinase family)